MPTAATNQTGLTATPVPSTPSKKKTPEQVARIAERRRERKKAVRTPDRQALIDYAQRLIFEADNAPDPETRRDLYRIAQRLQIRNTDDLTEQREAVFLLLNKWSLKDIPGLDVGLTVKDIASETGLPVSAVETALESLTSAEVDLVEIFTRGGRANCGRAGATLYYRARRKPAPR
jgi:MoxR-like ATPase